MEQDMDVGASGQDRPDTSAPGDGGASPIAAIVLAAGRSSRMGAHKLLLPLGGRPLVAHAVAAACASAADPVLVVLGHEAGRVRAALPPGRPSVVASPRHAEGMSRSLAAGLAAVPPECAGTLVLLGDQPLISAALLDRLMAAAREHPGDIISACYDGVRGSPVCFPRPYFAELLAIQGDEGGRAVVARHADRLRLVESGDLGSALDADDPEDYARLVALWEEWRGKGSP